MIIIIIIVVIIIRRRRRKRRRRRRRFHPDRAEVPEEEITLTKDPGADPHRFPPF